MGLGGDARGFRSSSSFSLWGLMWLLGQLGKEVTPSPTVHIATCPAPAGHPESPCTLPQDPVPPVDGEGQRGDREGGNHGSVQMGLVAAGQCPGSTHTYSTS